MKSRLVLHPIILTRTALAHSTRTKSTDLAAKIAATTLCYHPQSRLLCARLNGGPPASSCRGGRRTTTHATPRRPQVLKRRPQPGQFHPDFVDGGGTAAPGPPAPTIRELARCAAAAAGGAGGAPRRSACWAEAAGAVAGPGGARSRRQLDGLIQRQCHRPASSGAALRSRCSGAHREC